MKHFIGYTALFVCALPIIYGLWIAGKWINYKLAYESGVQTTVREMVKPECLRGNQ